MIETGKMNKNGWKWMKVNKMDEHEFMKLYEHEWMQMDKINEHW